MKSLKDKHLLPSTGKLIWIFREFEWCRIENTGVLIREVGEGEVTENSGRVVRESDGKLLEYTEWSEANKTKSTLKVESFLKPNY